MASTTILTSLHGREVGLNDRGDLVVNGKLIAYKSADQNSIAVLAGDSITAGSNQVPSVTSVTVFDQTVTVNCTNHGFAVGNTGYLGGSTDYSAWTPFTVASRISADAFTFVRPAGFPATVPGSSMIACVDARYTDRNFIMLAAAQLDQPFSKIVNRAVSGQRSGDIIQRFATDVLSLNPVLIYLSVGTNDCLTGVAEATIKANILSMVVAALDTGAKLILGTIPPIGPSATGYTDAINEKVLRLNRWIRELGDCYINLRIQDNFARLVNISDSDYLSGYSSDDVHPNGLGGRDMSDESLRILGGWFPRGTKRASTLLDKLSSDSGSLNRQLFANPTLSGTGGTLQNSCTGTLASNLLLTETGSGSAVATAGIDREDRRGYDQGIVFTAVAANDTFDLLGDSFETSVTPGAVIQLCGDLYCWNMSSLAYVLMWLDIIIDGVTYSCDALYSSGGSYTLPREFSGYFKSPRFVIPANASSITTVRPRWKWVFNAAGGGIATIGCPTVDRLELTV